MTCPVCGEATKVICCRKDCETVIRRRKCVSCGYVIYTEETECNKKVFSRLDKEYKVGRKRNERHGGV